MRSRFSIIPFLLLAMTVVGAMRGVASAEPVWDEAAQGGGDAGELPATAQSPSGAGALTTITGSLAGADADMFAVCLLSPADFSAGTTSVTLDTQLFLLMQAVSASISMTMTRAIPHICPSCLPTTR